MLLPSERQDKLVRATDIDALSCKFWANKKGYFSPQDPFLQPLVDSYNSNLRFCEGYTTMSSDRTLRSAFNVPKFPLINRGTYLRTYAIDLITERFIEENNGKCQIVALGGGSDTRSFRILKKYEQVSYVEVDFPELTKIKKAAIASLDDLQRIVGVEGKLKETTVINSKEDFIGLSSNLLTNRYHLIGYDIRNSEKTGSEEFLFLDRDVPTLVISECVLCYLSPPDFVGVLKFWRSFLKRVACVLFDPMSLDDGFGATMTSNLNNRGLDMQTFRAFPNLEARRALLEAELGFKAYLTDMAAVGSFNGLDTPLSWLKTTELARISRLEMMDEVEEIILMLRHYSLIYAENNMSSTFVNSLLWILRSENLK